MNEAAQDEEKRLAPRKKRETAMKNFALTGFEDPEGTSNYLKKTLHSAAIVDSDYEQKARSANQMVKMKRDNPKGYAVMDPEAKKYAEDYQKIRRLHPMLSPLTGFLNYALCAFRLSGYNLCALFYP